MLLSNAAIKRRTTVGVLIVLVLVAGVFSYVTLPREAAPDVPIPLVLISTSYEGVSPEDMESAVTIKIENKLSGLKGVKEIRSNSAEGISLITVEFLPDVVIEDALQYVRDKVDLAKGDLPTEAEEPVISEINVAEFPVMMINISGEISPVRLKAIADELEDVIEEVPGVLEADVIGALEREIRLEIDQDRLVAYGLTIPEILTLIPAENVNISAGGLETPGTKFNVRVPAEFVEPDKINELVLATRNGKPIYLTDIATVRDTFKDRTSYARLDGRSSITVAVKKRVGENIIVITETVKQIVEEARKRAPRGVKFELTLDQSKYIYDMLADLENNVFSGLVLVVAVLMLFLGFRTSVIVALAIPMSMLMSFFWIQALGYTLNMIVLFSLILSLGMLVDNAIVIVENIYRHMELGYDRIEAAMKGTAEVAWPVITSTATTVAAFSPLLFWPGVTGDFMKYLPITAIITLTSSLFVALIISPTICTVLASPGGRRKREKRHWFVGGYRALLRTTLNHKLVTVTLLICLLLGTFVLYGKRGRGVEFFPESDPERSLVNIRAPQGTNIRESDRLARLVEGRTEKYREYLEYLVANVGSGGDSRAAMFGEGSSGPHVANLTLMFYDYADRKRPSAEVVAELRDDLTDVVGAEVKVEKEKHGPPTGDPVTIRVIGEDFKDLEVKSEDARRLIEDIPGLVNLRSDLEATRPELVFTVDRQRAMLLGVNTVTIGNFIKTAVFGSKVSVYRQFNDEYDITVRLPQRQRERIEDLLRLQIPNTAGKSIPLSSLGRFEYKAGIGNISRVNQKRVVTLSADVEGRLGTAVLADVMDRLDPLGPTKFMATDVLDWPALLADLASGASNGRSAVTNWIWGMLSDRQRRTIQRAADSDDLSWRDKTAVVAVLNDIAGKQALYDKEIFGTLNLPVQARELLDLGLTNLSSKEQARLNRMLLEAAYPGALMTRPRLDLGDNYIRYAGEKEEQDEASAFLMRAFIFALLLIVMILVTQFNTLTVPLIIMSTVVLSLIGVLTGLMVNDLPFGIIMTGIGVISLAGVVVNNAIVLLDYTRQLQKRGLDLVSAAVQAGTTRLRPVLLTAVTTMLGLIPMATGISFDVHTFEWATKSESSEWWRSMAIAVIYGLGFATVLTLVVVPVFYVGLYRMMSRFGLGGLKQDQAAAGTPALEDF